MNYKKIILAGGNGYLGRILAAHYSRLAKEVIILSRKPHAPIGNVKTTVWDGVTKGAWMESLINADMLINLCGKNVNCRYTQKNKAEIINSRVIPTKLLGQVIREMDNPPKLWINVTSATIYRHAEDHPQDEETGEIGSGFSIDVCRKWEDAFFTESTPATRKIALRMGIVLGASDSVFPRLLNLVKYGLGGKQGNGHQYVSWIHEQDVAKCTEWLLTHKELDGIINCTTPVPVKNLDLMACIRNNYNHPFGLPAPVWLLKIGAIIIGTETELVLKSRWVLPTRLANSGYTFLFPKIDQAVKDILDTKVH